MRQTRRTAEGVKAHGGDKAMCFFYAESYGAIAGMA